MGNPPWDSRSATGSTISVAAYIAMFRILTSNIRLGLYVIQFDLDSPEYDTVKMFKLLRFYTHGPTT